MTDILDLSKLDRERPKVKLPNGAEYELLKAMDLGPARGQRFQRLMMQIQGLETEMESADEGELDGLEEQHQVALRRTVKLLAPSIPDEALADLPHQVLKAILTHFLATTGQSLVNQDEAQLITASASLPSSGSTEPPTP